MSRGLNRVQLIGNLGKELECKYMPNGDAVLNNSLAIGSSYKTKEGEKKDHTEWVNVVAFRKTAELLSEYCHKGSRIYVEGRMRTRQWDDKDGAKRYTTEVLIDSMLLLDSKPASSGQGDEGGEEPQTKPSSAGDYARASGGTTRKPPPPKDPNAETLDSDIPF